MQFRRVCRVYCQCHSMPIYTQCSNHYLRDEQHPINHTHTHTHTHTPPVTRRAANRAWYCLLPITPASSSPLLLDPSPTPIPTIPPPLHHRHKHLRLLRGCLLLCAAKRLFVRGERRILAIAGCRSVNLYCCALLRLHHINFANFQFAAPSCRLVLPLASHACCLRGY